MTAMIGPRTPPRPPARLTPPSTIAATLWSVYEPGHRCADPAGRGEGEPAEGGEETGQGVGDDLRRRRPRRRSGTPPGGGCRRRTATGRRSIAGAGARRAATTTARTTRAFGSHGLPSGPEMIAIIHGAAPPPGVLRMSRAVPAQTKDIASVTTMSGTFVTTTSAPLIAPTRARGGARRSRRATPNASPWSFIRTAEVTLREGHHRADRQVDPAGDDDDRLGDRGERDRQDVDRQGDDRRRRRSSG